LSVVAIAAIMTVDANATEAAVLRAKRRATGPPPPLKPKPCFLASRQQQIVLWRWRRSRSCTVGEFREKLHLHSSKSSPCLLLIDGCQQKVVNKPRIKPPVPPKPVVVLVPPPETANNPEMDSSYDSVASVATPPDLFQQSELYEECLGPAPKAPRRTTSGGSNASSSSDYEQLDFLNDPPKEPVVEEPVQQYRFTSKIKFDLMQKTGSIKLKVSYIYRKSKIFKIGWFSAKWCATEITGE